ncbi:MAG: hypothetical protein ACM3P1_00480, partial [Candidatus Saccharibacteria bacterium]
MNLKKAELIHSGQIILSIMEANKVVVYKTFMRPFEAYIVKGLLDANGIECFFTNEMFASRNPIYSSDVNGMKLNVFEKDIPKINELLNSENYS